MINKIFEQRIDIMFMFLMIKTDRLTTRHSAGVLVLFARWHSDSALQQPAKFVLIVHIPSLMELPDK